MSDPRVKLKYCNNEADDWTKVEDKAILNDTDPLTAGKETSKLTKTTKAKLTNESQSEEQTHSLGVAFGHTPCMQSPDGLSKDLSAFSPNTRQLLVEDSPANLTDAPGTSELPDQAANHDVPNGIDRQCREFLASPGLAEHRFILLTQYSLLRAFVQNANLLALDPMLFADDNALSPWTLSNPYPSNGPHTLSPTVLQLSTDHHPYLDLLAPPSLRDSILLASLDDEQEEEICNDIHCGSFTVWGSQPWNSLA
ncbi:MAG: hypothetical protein Q9194_007085 [Teloschistes cf. exilis]